MDGNGAKIFDKKTGKYICSPNIMSVYKRILLCILFVFLLLVTCTTVNAEQTGSCGPNATWSLSDNGVLTISGTGKVTGIPDDIKKSFSTMIVQNGITHIGGFSWCSNLTRVVFPEALECLEATAFYGCFELDDITIPAGVTAIERAALTGCGLLNLQVAEGNRNYKCVDGVLFSYDLSVLIQYPMNKTEETYVIPESVTTLGDSCFNRCHNLTSLIIPPNVTVIKDSAISDCFGLKTLTVPKTVEKVEDYSFGHNQNVTELVIEPGITELPDFIFYRYFELTSVVIPDSITSIGYKAFAEGQKLQSVTIPASVTYINPNAFNDCSELLVLYVQQGSYAEQFAKQQGIAYQTGATPQIASPVIQEAPESVQVGERFAVSLVADERSTYTTLYLFDPEDKYIGFEHLEGTSGDILYSRWQDTCSAGIYTCKLVSFGNNLPCSDEVVFHLNVTKGNRPGVPAIRMDPVEPSVKDIVEFIADRDYEGIILELYKAGSRYSGWDKKNTDRIEWPSTLSYGDWTAKIAVCVNGIWSYWREIPFTVEELDYVPVPHFEGCVGRTYTISLEYPDLKETYPVNLDETSINQLEYAFKFGFTDGTHKYEVMTCNFKMGIPKTVTVPQMQSNLWAVNDSSASLISDVELVVRDTSLVWTFDVPEEADLSKLLITNSLVLLPGEYYYGDTQVDISSGDNTKTLYLPENLKIIESEAFRNVAATEIDIPDGVEFIGENAFPNGVTLILGVGSQWWNWAAENGYNRVMRNE